MSDESSQQHQQTAIFCANGCGFYGNPSTLNLCSKCYKDWVKRNSSSPSTQSAEGSQSHSSVKEDSRLSSPVSIHESPIVQDKPSQPTDSPSIRSASTSCETKDSTPISSGKELPVSAVDNTSAKRTSSIPLTRCGCCNKKLGLLSFTCKCGKKFCTAHRFPESHNCSFDWKHTTDTVSVQSNPKLEPEKVARL